MIDKKEQYMIKALRQARAALRHGEVPVGAIIVNKQGEIIARGYNKVESKGCQCAHAEMIALQKACKKTGDWRLNGCWIYVTLEPCLMCFGLIQLSRIEGLVYGAQSPLFGCGVSKKGRKQLLGSKRLQIIKGVRVGECANLLQLFFKGVRMQKEKG